MSYHSHWIRTRISQAFYWKFYQYFNCNDWFEPQTVFVIIIILIPGIILFLVFLAAIVHSAIGIIGDIHTLLNKLITQAMFVHVVLIP